MLSDYISEQNLISSLHAYICVQHILGGSYLLLVLVAFGVEMLNLYSMW